MFYFYATEHLFNPLFSKRSGGKRRVETFVGY